MADEFDRYYEILGLSPGASAEEVKQAYRDLAKVWHPDRFAADDRLQHRAEEKLKDINKAYQRLKSRQPRPKAVRQSGFWSQHAEPPDTGGHDQWWRFQPPPDHPTPIRRPCGPKWTRVVAVGCAAVLLASFIYYLSGRGGPMPRVSEGGSSREKHNALSLSASLRYFTLGSTRKEVLEIQGEPDHFSPDALHYGTSHVLLKDGHVVGWTNVYPRLKVRWLPATPTTLSHFTLGSTTDEVLAAQGTPDRFTGDSFRYGESDVFFRNGRVTSWNNNYPRLKAQMLPANPTTMSHFALGSITDEVLAVQGTPDSFTGDSFHYGTSDVFFRNGRVVGWRNIYPRLRVQGRSQEGPFTEAEREK